MKLTDNFKLSEFTKSDYIDGNLMPNAIQIWIAKKLCENILQPVRSEFNFPIHINSGIRDAWITDTLRKKGYPVSTHSDHAYLDANVNQFGVGAADITAGTVDRNKIIFKWIMNNTQVADYVGQLIWYPDSNFIHISNNPILVYSGQFINIVRLWKQKYLVYEKGDYTRIEHSESI